MSQETIIAGIDIGTTKIAVLVGRKNAHGKLEVLGMGKAPSEGMMHGTIANIDKTLSSIEEAIREAEAQSGVDIKVVNASIAGRHIQSFTHQGGLTRLQKDKEIALEEVHQLVRDMYRTPPPAGSEILHVMPQHYRVDYESDITDPVGMTGVRLEGDFHIITAQASAIHNLDKCIRRAGLGIDQLVLDPLASSLAVLSEAEKEAGVCLVDIGGGTTDIAIFHDGIIRHTAVIPIGGSSISSDIKQGCRVMEHQAEMLKVKFGSAVADEAHIAEVVSIPGLHSRPAKEVSVYDLHLIIEARMEEIMELVHAQILASQYQDKLSAGLVITGGGAQLKHLRQLAEYITGMDARMGFASEHLAGGDAAAVDHPMYATMIGLVLAGFKDLDARESYYKAQRSQSSWHTTDSTLSKGNFLKRVLDRTRSLLLDAYEDSSDVT